MIVDDCEVTFVNNSFPLMANTESPAASVCVQLRIFGSFSLCVGDQNLTGPITNPSKLRTLLCYLILNRHRAVSHGELIETLFEDDGSSNPIGALKMQIKRIRTALMPLFSEEVSPIISRRGSYQWNPDLACLVDAEIFEQYCQEVESSELSDEEKILRYSQIIDLYYSTGVLDSDTSLWSKTLWVQYHRRYISAVESYSRLLDKCGNHSEMENLCIRAIAQDATNEDLYVLLITALLKQKKFSDARRQYKSIVDLLYNELGVRPSEALQALYERCEEEENPQKQDLSSILVSMRNPDGKRDAFFCGFEQFKSMYQLEARRALRTGGCLHVALLTVLGNDQKQLPPTVNNLLMQQVQQVVVQNLRQSDVVAQYSNCQFIIMLPYANLEDSCMVMNRVIHAYHTKNPRTMIDLSFQVRALELV